MKNNNYLEILNLCHSKESITVEEIVAILKISPSTVRREIVKLERDGLVTRFHGGIISNYSSLADVPYDQRKDLYKEEKKRIAKKAASLIQDHSFVCIDSGTTCAMIADYITAKNIIVVTNGIEMVKPLVKKGCDVSLPAGQIIQDISLYVDCVQYLDYFDDFTFDIAFIGTNSINDATAFASRSLGHSAILKKMISRSKKVYILSDHSKYGVVNRYTFARFNEATLITDQAPYEGLEELDYIIAEE